MKRPRFIQRKRTREYTGKYVGYLGVGGQDLHLAETAFNDRSNEIFAEMLCSCKMDRYEEAEEPNKIEEDERTEEPTDCLEVIIQMPSLMAELTH